MYILIQMYVVKRVIPNESDTKISLPICYVCILLEVFAGWSCINVSEIPKGCLILTEIVDFIYPPDINNISGENTFKNPNRF